MFVTEYLGFDTETPNGYAKLLCLGDGRFTELQGDVWSPDSICPAETDRLLTFLYNVSKEGEGKTLVAWNLGFDTAALLKPWVHAHASSLRKGHYKAARLRKRIAEFERLGSERPPTPEECRQYQQDQTDLDGEETVARFTTRKFRVGLIGSKGMSITPKGDSRHHRRDETVWLFDAAAWYASGFGNMSLEKAASKYLGEHKNAEDLGIDRAAIGTQRGYYEAHRGAIIKYCVQDSALAAHLMERTEKSFTELGYPFPKKPFSRASVSREYLKKSGVLEETIKAYKTLMSDPDRNLWRLCFSGGVFLLLRAGRLENPYSLDVNSAYPNLMVNFPSLEGAYAVGLDHPDFKRAYFRFYRVRCGLTPRTPMRDAGETRKIYAWDAKPVEIFLTGLDLDAMDLCGDPYTVLEGVGIVCPSGNRPLAYLGEIYDRKNAVKDDPTRGGDSVEYWALKILLNGTYGILAQRRPHESRYTNLIYASYITAGCRLLLWKAVKETEDRGDVVTQIATDGLSVVGESAREFWRERDSGTLGAWSYTPHTESINFESGVSILDRKTTKRRGMPTLEPALLQVCEDNFLSATHDSPVHLREAIIQRKTDRINVFRPVTRTLNPAQAAADAGQSFPKDFGHAPLKAFFTKSWPLYLRGAHGWVWLTHAPPQSALEAQGAERPSAPRPSRARGGVDSPKPHRSPPREPSGLGGGRSYTPSSPIVVTEGVSSKAPRAAEGRYTTPVHVIGVGNARGNRAIGTTDRDTSGRGTNASGPSKVGRGALGDSERKPRRATPSRQTRPNPFPEFK